MRLLSPQVVWLGAVTLLAGGCSLLAEFKDREGDAADDGGAPDGPLTSINPGGRDASTDGSVAAVEGGTVSEAGAPETAGPVTCADKANGFDMGNNMRCCGGVSTRMDTNANCGACGIDCNTDKNHSCIAHAGRFYCAGCNAAGGGGSGACFTGCCFVPFTQALGVCTPELGCGAVAGVSGFCNDSPCETKAPGTQCHSDTVDGNYCSY